MLGNDVVDLQQAALESNWQRKGYLSKVCSPEEQYLILGAGDPSYTFWLLWSMKEAAYKVVNRMTGLRDYSPVKYTCQNITTTGTLTAAEVIYGELNIRVSSESDGHYIHSTALAAQCSFRDLITYSNTYHSAYVTQFNRATPAYHLEKDVNGLPAITAQHTGKKYLATVSHHGQYLFIIYSDFLLLTG